MVVMQHESLMDSERRLKSTELTVLGDMGWFPLFGEFPPTQGRFGSCSIAPMSPMLNFKALRQLQAKALASAQMVVLTSGDLADLAPLHAVVARDGVTDLNPRQLVLLEAAVRTGVSKMREVREGWPCRMVHSLSQQQGLLVLVTQHLVFWHQVVVRNVDQQSALVEVFELELTSHRIDNLQEEPPKSVLL